MGRQNKGISEGIENSEKTVRDKEEWRQLIVAAMGQKDL